MRIFPSLIALAFLFGCSAEPTQLRTSNLVVDLNSDQLDNFCRQVTTEYEKFAGQVTSLVCYPVAILSTQMGQESQTCEQIVTDCSTDVLGAITKNNLGNAASQLDAPQCENSAFRDKLREQAKLCQDVTFGQLQACVFDTLDAVNTLANTISCQTPIQQLSDTFNLPSCMGVIDRCPLAKDMSIADVVDDLQDSVPSNTTAP